MVTEQLITFEDHEIHLFNYNLIEITFFFFISRTFDKNCLKIIHGSLFCTGPIADNLLINFSLFL